MTREIRPLKELLEIYREKRASIKQCFRFKVSDIIHVLSDYIEAIENDYSEYDIECKEYYVKESIQELNWFAAQIKGAELKEYNRLT